MCLVSRLSRPSHDLFKVDIACDAANSVGKRLGVPCGKQKARMSVSDHASVASVIACDHGHACAHALGKGETGGLGARGAVDVDTKQAKNGCHILHKSRKAHEGSNFKTLTVFLQRLSL